MSQKNKNIVLVLGLVLVVLIAYFFGISKTIEVSNQLSILKQKQQLYQSAPQQLALLANKEKALDQVLQENNLTGLSLQNNLLEVLNKESLIHIFKITAFNEPHKYFDETTKSTVSTYQFEISGSYNSIIQVIHNLEQKYSFGNVVHLNFKTKKNYRTRKKSLLCSVFLQRIH